MKWIQVIRMILASWCALGILGGVRADQELFKNPVFEPVFADPSIVRGEDGFFYAYATQDDWGDGEGARKVPVIRSRNLVEWDYLGQAFESRPGWRDRGGIWAPHISRFNGKYYLYYSISIWHDPNPGIGVALADHPAGPFQDQGKLFDSEEIGVKNSIDPQLFVADDGIPYLFWGSWNGIWGIELHGDGLGFKGEKFQIAGGVFEAPYVYQRSGHYYFFGSLGSCCDGLNSTYRVAVGRSEALKGPYLDRNGEGLLDGAGTLLLAAGKQFIAPGHVAVVLDDADREWLLYHAVDRDQPRLNRITRRPLMMDPLHWQDDWPEIKNGTPGDQWQKRPVIRP
jgi:arabinan endo-1,5-alpha-L-arabinosidase